jgi:pilus assembly protein CpaE
MKDLLRIAIVDPNETTRDELRTVLLGMETVWLEADSPRYEFFLDVIQQSIPDVVIVSLDSDQSKALTLIAQLAQNVPGLSILAVSARGDGQAILQALRSGAREFLTIPVVLEDLIKALNRLQPRDTGGMVETINGNGVATKVESKVIAILGSRGGVGCTSVAVNVGATLAQVSGFSPALIDLDLALGDSDVALDLPTDYTLADVAVNIDRLDMAFLRRSLSKHSTGLSLLPHPMQMEDAALIREEHLQRMIGLLRASYTHLLLDLSKSFSPTDVTALRSADVILLIAQLELTSLRNVVRMLTTLDQDQEMGPKVQLVLNRVGSECDIDKEKAEQTTGRPIYWELPNDPLVLMESRNHGVPLVQHAPKSKVQMSIIGLVNKICGHEVLAGQKEKARGWAGLFSRR